MRKKPVILLFIDWYVPGYKAGGPIRSCANMISALKDEYDFKVVTRDSDYTEENKYPGIISDQWTTGPYGESVYYFSAAKLNRKNLRSMIQSVEYDFAYINGIYSFYFSILPLILCRRKTGKQIIIGTRGMLAETAIAVKGGRKKLFLNLARFAGIYKHVIFHATNNKESQDIQRVIHRDARIVIADNFPLAAKRLNHRISAKKKGVLRIINIARIAPEKNLDFALKILQKIQYPKIIFDVYGPVYDQHYFESCQLLAKANTSCVEVNFKGSLAPEKVGETLSQYDLFFMPTRGENFGHSISESLMNGTPVLISDQTPWNEVNDKKCGRAVALSDEISFVAFINEMNALSQSEHQQMVDAALKLSAEKNNTPQLLERYRLLFS